MTRRSVAIRSSKPACPRGVVPPAMAALWRRAWRVMRASWASSGKPSARRWRFTRLKTACSRAVLAALGRAERSTSVVGALSLRGVLGAAHPSDAKAVARPTAIIARHPRIAKVSAWRSRRLTVRRRCESARARPTRSLRAVCALLLDAIDQVLAHLVLPRQKLLELFRRENLLQLGFLLRFDALGGAHLHERTLGSLDNGLDPLSVFLVDGLDLRRLRVGQAELRLHRRGLHRRALLGSRALERVEVRGPRARRDERGHEQDRSTKGPS